MTNSLVLLLVGGALVLLILLNDAARKIAALLVLAAIAFGLGWFWPKPANDLRAVEAKSSQPCISAF